MNRYKGRIQVVCPDNTAFPVDAKTLDATGVSGYDPWAWSDPPKGVIDIIDVSEWNIRRNSQRRKVR